MSNKHLKSQSTSQTGGKWESRGPQWDIPTTPAKTGGIKKKKTLPRVGKDVEQLELRAAGGKGRWDHRFEKWLGLSYEVKHSLPHDSDH